MNRARKESAFHLALLVLIQWISLAVVILNATALFMLRKKQHAGLVNQISSSVDYVLLALGTLSFIGSSFFLLLHLHIHFRIIDDCSYAPPRALSVTEVIIAVVSIASWAVSTSLILSHTQEPTSPCKLASSLYTGNQNDICELFDTILMLAFAAVGGWILVLLATLFILIRSPIPPTTIFTIEAPPQRFSQPMMVSLPDEVYSTCGTTTRPYYLGHNKVRPAGSVANPPHVLVAVDHKDMNQSSQISSSGSRQTIMMLHDYSSYYEPHRNMALSSPSSMNNIITEDSTSSSYYLSGLPNVDSQRSLSTLDSIFTGYQPIILDLPIIQGFSQFDVSFLEKKESKTQ